MTSIIPGPTFEKLEKKFHNFVQLCTIVLNFVLYYRGGYNENKMQSWGHITLDLCFGTYNAI